MLGCYLHFELHLSVQWWMLIPSLITLTSFHRLPLELGWVWTVTSGFLCVVAGLTLAQYHTPSLLPKGDYVGIVEVKTSGKERGNRLEFRAEDLELAVDVSILADSTCILQPGNIIHVEGWNSGFIKAVYPYQFDERRFAQVRGISAKVYVKNLRVLDTSVQMSTRQVLLERVENWPVSERARAFYSAMLLGDKSKIDSDDKQAFATSGLVHVLAVSGLHVGLIALFLERISSVFKRLRGVRTRIIRTLFVLVGIWGFVWLSGMGVSVVRAGMLFTFVQVARMTGRRGVTAEAVWFAAALLVCLNPITIFDLGFQLSFAAVFGIVYGHSMVEAKLRTIELPKAARFILSSASVSLWAQWATSAITLYHFHQFPTYFLLSNVLMLPLMPVLLILGILLLLMDLSGTSISLIWWLADTLVEWFFMGVTWLSSLPGALISPIYISSSMALAIAVGFALVIISIRKKWKYAVEVAVLLPLVFLPVDVDHEIWIHQHKQEMAIELEKEGVSTLYVAEPQVYEKLRFISEKWRESRGIDSLRLRLLPLLKSPTDSDYYANDLEGLILE